MKSKEQTLRTKSSVPIDHWLVWISICSLSKRFHVKVKKLFDKVCQMKYSHLSIYTYIIYLHIYLFLFLS